MFHYFGRTEDKRGNSLANWQVECVQLSDLSTVVPIYADESSTPIITVSGVANRAVSDEFGNFDLFVLDGTYGLKFYDANGVYTGLTQRYLPMYGADNSGASGRFFPDLASGEAGSATGQYFSYPGDTGELIFRERTAGGSTVISDAATKAQVDAKVATAALAAAGGAALTGKTGGGTVQDWINAPIIGAHTFAPVSPGDPNSAVLVRSNAAGRRGEVQVSPNDGVGGATLDADAGGEFTLYGYDVRGPLGAANNIAATWRYRRVAGVCVSYDLFSFAPGTTADVPFRIGNEAQGYHSEWSATTGRVNFRLGVTSGGKIAVGGGGGTFSTGNPLPNFAAIGDQPSLDFEEWFTSGADRINWMRQRFLGNNWYMSRLDPVTGAVLANNMQVSNLGPVYMANINTAITTGGNFTPNAYFDPANGEIKRAAWSKVAAAADATDLATAITLVNQIKSVLQSYGIMS